MTSKSLSAFIVSALVFLVVIPPSAHSDPVGETYLAGTTWWDIQHNGTCGRQVQVLPDGSVPIVWMNGLNSGGSDRHIYYNLWQPGGGFSWLDGVQIDQSQRSGYCEMDLDNNGRQYLAFHQQVTSTGETHSAVAVEDDFGMFIITEMVSPFGFTPQSIWPQLTVDNNGRIHLVTTEVSSSPGMPKLHYSRGIVDPGYYTVEFDVFYQTIDSVMNVSSDINSSPVSDRVAMGWLDYAATQPEFSQNDTDLIICISEDGETWDFSDTINVTNWIPPDTTLLPDTTAANKDTLRCYTDMCLMFDHNDVLHVFFSTRGYYPIQGILTWGSGFIWHWDEINQVFSMVANGWFQNSYYDPGAWNIYAQRPSSAIDPETGDLYCLYQRYFDPIPDTGLPYPYLLADTTDFSAGGLPNGEVWITKSIDGGLSWAEGINITDTNSPNALAGDCLSEVSPSISEEIADGYCHLWFIRLMDS
ncbi:MAG: hypothetical protein H8E46_05640 [FCB group bacterium]|nr:hypothetical protein [FCB group bacterium]